MRRSNAAACYGILALMVGSQAAHAERWVQVGADDERLWYDDDSVRPTANGLITVWISAGPARTMPGPDGTTIYPTHSVIDCRDRTAGSKFSFDLGESLQPYDASSSIGELITKLCSFKKASR